jgi:fructokinase
MPDIITIGELIIDFTAVTDKNGEIFYKQNAGGAPANVAVMASNLGISSGFIGKIGKDMFGKYLKEVLNNHKVNTDGLIMDNNHSTTLAFVKNNSSGERDFVFYRKNSADQNLNYSDINLKLIDSCKIFHFGALSLTAEPAKTATISAVEYAKSKGKIITYDPNWRPALWNSKSEAEMIMRSVLSLCDIVKVSEEELLILTDSGNLLTSVAKLLNYGISIVCITQGAKGCIIATKHGIERYPTFKVDIVDTLGAGDSFFGAFLAQIIKSGKRPENLTTEDLKNIAIYSNACGALSSTKYGAIPAMPTHEEILDCIGRIKTY